MISRRLWLFWIAGLVFLAAFAVYPVSYRLTRAIGLALMFVIWSGLIALTWRRRALRFALLAITVSIAGFLVLPRRTHPDSALLRGDYVAALRRYEGVRYIWGGESRRGIDCSGLVRRGIIDSLACRGLRSFDPGCIRDALSLWWNDCTASALGELHRSLTVHVLDTPSINGLDHSQILPGDMAVTSSGIHIMAFVGDNSWIEADPEKGRVITISAPAEENPWFLTPMNIVRWSILQ
jgi:hypothetical protein